jgi:hypothetical protein
VLVELFDILTIIIVHLEKIAARPSKEEDG